MPMKTIEGYSKEKYTNTSVLLAGGGAKALSDFIGSLSWDSTNKKIKYTPVEGNTTDLVTLSWDNIANKPTSLPANGGNADTVDNKHASDFATAGHTHSLGNKSAADLSSTYPQGISVGGIYANGYPFQFGSTITAYGSGGYFQIAGQWNSNVTGASNYDFPTEMYIRGRRDSYDVWTTWTRVLTDRNYTNVLDNRYYTETEVNNLLAKYLPLAGGTMTGDITMSGMNTHLNWNVDYLGGWARDFIVYNQHNSSSGDLVNVFHLGGYGNTNGFEFAYIGTSSYDGNNLRFNKDGSITIGSGTIWHSNNDGSGSGLDADTVDNKHASDFMPASGSYIGGTTVADVKANLLNYFRNKPATTTAYTQSTFVNNFGNDSYTIQNSSVCGWIALNPGYDNYNHGHFLVSEYGNARLRLVGLGYNTWYGPYTIAYTSDIPSSLPANGGNADTVDNLHAVDFVRAYTTYGASYSIDSDWGQSIVTFDPVCGGTYPLSTPNATILNMGDNYARRKQLFFDYSSDYIYFRRHNNSSWTNWVRLALISDIPTVGNGTVTVTQAGNSIGSFTMNQSGNTLIDLNDTNTNYYPIRSYTSGLQISSGSGSTDCVLYVPYASNSQAGVVNTETQTFGGAKTFTGAMTVNNTITFGTSDSYGIRTASDNYCRIGESTKRFYQCYVKNSYSTNGFYEDSDERLKNIIKSVKVDLDELSKLRKIYYIWKNPKENQSLQLGMIAQDVQRLYPELVSVDKETGYLSLAYDRISVIALEAIDTLYEEYKQLKERVNELEKLLHSKEIL